ncbi:hypothetical protein JCM33374_g1646 [Metschnikowia sp. JCM 33374]|nr:hypothetical protein JCM33374_g1646 [Metschnikowia sp. JCM 33374]
MKYFAQRINPSPPLAEMMPTARCTPPVSAAYMTKAMENVGVAQRKDGCFDFKTGAESEFMGADSGEKPSTHRSFLEPPCH